MRPGPYFFLLGATVGAIVTGVVGWNFIRVEMDDRAEAAESEAYRVGRHLDECEDSRATCTAEVQKVTAAANGATAQRGVLEEDWFCSSREAGGGLSLCERDRARCETLSGARCYPQGAAVCLFIRKAGEESGGRCFSDGIQCAAAQAAIGQKDLAAEVRCVPLN